MNESWLRWEHQASMSLNLDFPEDGEFSRAIRREPEIDLPLAFLEIARDAQPGLSFDPTLEWIDRRAAELSSPLARSRNHRQMLRELGRCLAGTHGLHGSREAFEDPQSSYLNRVIATGVGIPISLSIVYVAVAERAGVDLAGVASPMHFLCRHESPEGPLFVDAFNQGRIMEYSQCIDWLEELTQADGDLLHASLEPARPRDILMRMLNNLKSVHVRRQNWTAAWQVQRRLTALDPEQYEARRDLGFIALKSQHVGLAYDLLQSCLNVAPESDVEALEKHVAAAARMLAQLN